MFFLEAVESQALDAVSRAESLLGLQEGFRARLRSAGVKGRAEQVSEQLIANPFITTPRVRALLNVTPQGAQYVIKQLIKTGILSFSHSIGRTNVYVSDDVLSVLA
jgi:predicted HTH transcriptional regulator